MQAENYGFSNGKKAHNNMKRTSLALFLTLVAGALSAQEAPQQTFTRNVLLEQFTTKNCGYCPAGATAQGTATRKLSIVK